MTDESRRKAIDYLREQAGRFPDHAGIQEDLASQLFQVRDYDAAEKIYRKLTKMKPDDIDYLRQLLRCVAQRKNSSEIAPLVSRSNELLRAAPIPDEEKFKQIAALEERYADALADENLIDRFIAAARSDAATSPGYAINYRRLGDLYLQRGMLQLAASEYLRAVSMGQDAGMLWDRAREFKNDRNMTAAYIFAKAYFDHGVSHPSIFGPMSEYAWWGLRFSWERYLFYCPFVRPEFQKALDTCNRILMAKVPPEMKAQAATDRNFYLYYLLPDCLSKIETIRENYRHALEMPSISELARQTAFEGFNNMTEKRLALAQSEAQQSEMLSARQPSRQNLLRLTDAALLYLDILKPQPQPVAPKGNEAQEKREQDEREEAPVTTTSVTDPSLAMPSSAPVAEYLRSHPDDQELRARLAVWLWRAGTLRANAEWKSQAQAEAQIVPMNVRRQWIQRGETWMQDFK
ncbi:MAG: hypothetical protein NTX50_13080 [Candidatus Sumerlaeota bacterium]|nr:hypothetical protein [Candidatus Sumerlaeota bacterium]